MRVIALLWVGLLSLLMACTGKGDAKEGGGEVANQSAQLDKAEDDVLSRREELSRARRKISQDRAQLIEKRKLVAAQGGDVHAMEKEEEQLVLRESQIEQQEGALEKTAQEVMRQYRELLVAGAAKGDVTAREASVSVREKDFSRREDSMARREAELAERERDLAKREKETCRVGPATTTIVQAAASPASGSKYSKKDVEPVLGKAHRKMSEKGLLSSDLPPMASTLEREATQAMGEGDFGRAKFAAEQLLSTVEGLGLDKSFIAGKINRLNGAMKGKTLQPATRAEVDQLFRGATSDYGDGKFAAANGKLNKIHSLIH
jgi:hypothetical protein